MITVVYVCGDGRDNDAIVVYKDNKQVGYLAPSPNYGNFENIIKSITNQEIESFNVEQIGEEYPDTLDEMEKWPRA